MKFYGEYKYTESSYDMTTETVNYEFDVEDFFSDVWCFL